MVGKVISLHKLWRHLLRNLGRLDHLVILNILVVFQQFVQHKTICESLAERPGSGTVVKNCIFREAHYSVFSQKIYIFMLTKFNLFNWSLLTTYLRNKCINVSCLVRILGWRYSIIWPFFLKYTARQVAKLQDMDFDDMWFQQYVATCHASSETFNKIMNQ